MPAARDLPDLEVLLARVVLAALSERGLVIEADPILYSAGSVDDCCPPAGGKARLIVWWSPIDGGQDCGGPLTVTIHLRLLTCWPIPGDPLHVNDQQFTEASSFLARTAWIGTTALRALECDRQAREAIGISSIHMGPTTPKPPKGGCAGTDWTLRVKPRAIGWADVPSATA